MNRPETAAADGSAAITLEGVVVARERHTILDVPRLEIPAGSVTVLFGPNGAGKTTLLRLIAGLDRPDTGVVRVGGLPGGATGGVAYAFQEAVFLRGSVRANLGLGLELRGVPPAERGLRVEAAARDCGIAPLLERQAHSLSGGEAQRANLARALALRAPVTLLDEPLAAFDRVGRAAFLEELARLLHAVAGTVVLVTHDREEAFRLADRIVVLAAGRVRANGRLRAVLAHPPDRATAELLGFTVLVDDAGATLGIPPGSLHPGRGDRTFRFLVERVTAVGLEERVVGRIVTRAAAVPAEVPLPARAAHPAAGETIEVHPATWVEIG